MFYRMLAASTADQIRRSMARIGVGVSPVFCVVGITPVLDVVGVTAVLGVAIVGRLIGFSTV